MRAVGPVAQNGGMTPQETIDAYWTACAARDWSAFGVLLADDVVYELPQTRERVVGREAFVGFNAEYPGDWRVTVERAAVAEGHAATWIRFAIDDGDEQPALSFFDFDAAGLICRVTEFWPEPYEPPAGREHLVERF